MDFLQPWALFLLAAAGVPLVIHLLSRRRIPEIPFGSLRFLSPSERQSMRRVDLRRLLLLVLRMAAVALLALAFARPVVRGGLAGLFPAAAPRSVVLLVDRSWSMGAATGGGTVLDAAKERAAEVLDRLEAGDELTVIFFDDRAETVLDAAPFDRGTAMSVVRPAGVSWRTTDLRAAVREARRAFARADLPARELYLVSDFQRGALGLEGPAAETKRAAAGAPKRERGEAAGDTAGDGGQVTDRADDGFVRAFLLPVRATGTDNTAIERIDAPRTVVHRGEAIGIAVHLRGAGNAGAPTPLRVLVDGHRIAERETVVPPDGRRVERFVFPAERAGWLRCEARSAPDRLAADDTRRFAVEVRERLDALLLADGDALYLEQALAPDGSEGDIALVRRGWREFTSADLETGAVVLGPGRGPLPGDIALIERFVEEGGHALLFVLPETEETARRLSRRRLDIGFGDPDGLARLIDPVPGTALLAPFDREDIERLSRIRIAGGAVVRGVPAGAAELRFDDGSPLVWREARGEGEVVFACLQPGSGALVLSPWFLPLVQQALLAPGGEAAAPAGLLVGEVLGFAGTAETVLLPGGAIARPGPGGVAAGEPGFAEIRGPAGTRLVAVNPDCRLESDLSPIDPRAAADSLGFAHAAVVAPGEAVAERVRDAREGREISTQLAAVALALLAAELVAAQKAGRSGDVG